MSTEDRLDTYLTSRAGALPVDAGDPAQAVGRAAERRRSRRALGSGVIAGVVALGAVGVVASRSGEQGFQTATGQGGSGSTTTSIADSSGLTWTTVDLAAGGLGWTGVMGISGSSVALDDGSSFSISTAPAGGPDTLDPVATLYRSGDGKTWEQRSLPSGMRPTGIATSGGQLYAVGTAPAGGSMDAVLAVSGDGASSWDEQVRLPLPEAALMAQHPESVTVTGVRVAVGASGVVAAANVAASIDVDQLLGAIGVSDHNYQQTATGVDLFEPVRASDCEGRESDPEAPVPAVPTSTAAPTTTVVAAEPPAAPAGTTVGSLAPDGGKAISEACEIELKRRWADAQVVRSITWTELGVSPEIQGLIGGRTHLFHAPAGGSFSEVPFPAADGRSALVLAEDEGAFRLLAGGSDGTDVRPFRSADGTSWTADGPGVDGYVSAVGSLGGRPAVLLSGPSSTLLTTATDTGWTTIDHTAAVQAAAGPHGWVGAAGVGPLGVVVVAAGPDDAPPVLLTSPDGASLAPLDLPDLGAPRTGSYVTGVEVNADAVIIRVNVRDPQAPYVVDHRQRLLVGTRA